MKFDGSHCQNSHFRNIFTVIFFTKFYLENKGKSNVTNYSADIVLRHTVILKLLLLSSRRYTLLII